jgi:hypothetical protein
VLTYAESAKNARRLASLLQHLLFLFIKVREAAYIPVSRLRRISLEQYDALISGLLDTPSGGRLPVLVVVCAFQTMKDCLGLDWTIETQGINEADSAKGAGGDITLKRNGVTVLAAEVTERTVDKSRVIATFNTKIAPAGIEDYLFFLKKLAHSEDVLQQARQYFSQGHEVNFIEVKNWILMMLATLGHEGRTRFGEVLVERLEAQDMPKSVKVSWNEQISRITG